MNKLQTQIEQTLTTAIRENDIPTQMILHVLLGIRRAGVDDEIRKEVGEFSRKMLWVVLAKMKRNLIVQSN